MTITQTFTPTGADQSFVVPAWVSTAAVTVRGSCFGQGGTIVGGRGAAWTGTIAVTPGETITVRVGVRPTTLAGGGWPDGGDRGLGPGAGVSDDAGSGGGSSSLYRGATLLIIAGAGGGTTSGFALPGSTEISPGTHGDAGLTSGTGKNWSGYDQFGEITTGGFGATTSAGGAAGSPDAGATAGSFGQGGKGGDAGVTHGSSGGGGGGYYGGGGGGARSNGQSTGGGGGSSFASAFVSTTGWTQAAFNLAGLVTFSYDDEPEPPEPSEFSGRWHLGS